MTGSKKAEQLKKELGAKVESYTAFRAKSADGKIVANGNTELAALQLLKKAIQSQL